MSTGNCRVGKRMWSLVGLVSVILTMDAAFLLASSSSIPLFSQSAVPRFLMGLAVIMISLACLMVFLLIPLKNRKILLQKDGIPLELVVSEKAAGQGGEEELKLIEDGLGHRPEEKVLLSTVIEKTEDNILIADHRRTILYINPAFERSCGYACAELKGKSLRYLRSDQHDKAFFQTMKDALNRGEVWIGAIVNRGKDGADFEIEGSISPIKDNAGAISHWVAVGRNMSHFRKLERELQRVQKMDALGTLAGGIAHDFNNVLAAVMGLVEMEYLGSSAGSRTRNRMEQALTACNRARDLVKQILAFSSQGGERRQSLCIGPVVEEALQMMRATLPATITIRSDLAAGAALILGDSSQIHQVLINLCTNAAHAMRKTGGVLGIVLQEVEVRDSDVFAGPELQSGSYLRLEVSDTGEGMNQQVRERIFEPFYTTKGPGEGAGVGLSVVHGIVKGHGGKISVRSEPGKGSSFQLFFPKIDGVEDDQEESPFSLPSGHELILLVDDEELVVAVAADMLKVLGYEVVAVHESPEALKVFRAQSDRFQLIISDQTMPCMTGMELAAELLKIRPDIPIILCTGYLDQKIGEAARAIGIKKIMAKPFVMQELASSLRDLLDQAAARGTSSGEEAACLPVT
ncbi:MAG: ATP-binding protein [Desulfocapsaceae bacterium]|nr:ATP-binding protein [Desulfocapsaceae bacterium]